MKPTTKEFRKATADTLKNKQVQSNLNGLYNGFHKARITAASNTEHWEEMQEKARSIKAHTIDHLDHYLRLLDSNVTKAGGKTFFASDGEAAAQYVLKLAKSKGVKIATKSKSMVSEEIGLNRLLIKEGIQPIETDLGEYIIQLADETPYHIIAPAIHKSKEEVSQLFHDKLDSPRLSKITDLTAEARGQLRTKFIEADMGITGGNFLIAETGTLVLVTNEGNGRMCTSMPKIHVAIVGMEKIIPSMDDLSIFLRLLIRSATGQRLTSYVTTVTGPRQASEEDGPEEFHLVIVDNGRTKLLENPDLRETLYCLRCGACLNACPVYRKVGGHSYGWVYSGPIGAIVSPVLTNLSDSKDLPFASTLCGACKEACPVKINIPRMLLYLRKELTEGNSNSKYRNVGIPERIAMKIWGLSMANSITLKITNRIIKLLQIPFLRNGRITKLPPPLSGWTMHRTLPRLASKPFNKIWSEFFENNNS